ncbi:MULTISPECIES: TonB-dependent receptor [Flavobacteriaceae]|uniref:TonB-dependent receptor n=1 Tax=Flavobacteriaceae TaxID=49546 RepID=UPI0014922E0B|nr:MULTISPECIES: TonB-dependent receptor [Allomuricauda]MDC6366717.1 TonB-dependent receptor [Muricauda sp. AC10]
MKKFYFLYLLFFGLSSITYAQQGSIAGKVTTSDNKPLSDVNIQISGTSNGTVTDKKGNYLFSQVPQGTYTLIFSSVGFSSKEITVSVSAGRTTKQNISLNEVQQQLNEVVLEGQHTKYVSRDPSTSLRLKTELVKLPQNIQVVSTELLNDQQATSIMEGVIRNVSGVTMLEHWGHFARVNMRGFRLPAFRNGVNFQDTWGPLSEDMAFVERIEFVKGPAGFMMSAGEPGGFYNVVTKKPTENFIANASITGGSFDFYRGTVDASGKLTENGKLLGRINAMYQSGDTHRGNEVSTRYGVAPSFTYNISENTSLTAEMNLQEAEVFIGSAYVFGPVSEGYGSLDRDFKYTDDNYRPTDIEELTLFANFSHQFSDNWGIEGQFSHMRYDQEGNSTWLWSFDGDTGDAVRYASAWDALSLGTYAQAYLNGSFNTGAITHKIMGGFDFTDKEYWADFNQFGLIDDPAQPFNIYNPVYGNTVFPEFDRSVDVRNRENAYNYGFINRSYYAQDEINFLDGKARLTLAGRYTHLSTNGKGENDTKVTPRAGLSVDIIPSLTAYALYDQSFLASAGIDRNGNTFDPVEGNDIEGGIKKSFFDGRLRTSLGAYLITKQNVLVADPEDPNFSIQLGEVQSKGIEFDMQGQITPELSVVLNYANTNVEITEDTNPDNIGTRVAGHAKHMTNSWFNYNFNNASTLKGFGLSLGYQYQIERSTWAWGADNESELPNYFRLDGALSWQNDHFRVQLNVNNILDEYLYSGSSYANYLYWQSEPGINGRLKVTYSF